MDIYSLPQANDSVVVTVKADGNYIADHFDTDSSRQPGARYRRSGGTNNQYFTIINY